MLFITPPTEPVPMVLDHPSHMQRQYKDSLDINEEATQRPRPGHRSYPKTEDSINRAYQLLFVEGSRQIMNLLFLNAGVELAHFSFHLEEQ